MKKFLATIIVLFGSAALACPDLTGTYMCPSYDENGNDIVVETAISQRIDANGITHYTFDASANTFEWPADGNFSEFSFKDDESGSDFTIGMQLTCNGNTLTQYTSVKEIDVNGAEEFTSVNDFMIKDGTGNIVHDYTVVYEGQTYQSQSVCMKK